MVAAHPERMLFLDLRLPLGLLGFFAFGYLVFAEEECLNSKIWCYECESWNDPRCADPFNMSTDHQDSPFLRLCEGCCVKIVGKVGTPNETVRRTCTKSLHINLFLVDHVCMLESRGVGHMCFCEKDACNSAPQTTSLSMGSAILLIYACLRNL